MIRYWFAFRNLEDFSPVSLGCGVTAENKGIATDLVQDLVFKGTHFEVHSIIEDIDISSLDSGHVRPNMGNPILKGIWFPLGF